jgi:hypothetical protein
LSHARRRVWPSIAWVRRWKFPPLDTVTLCHLFDRYLELLQRIIFMLSVSMLKLLFAFFVGHLYAPRAWITATASSLAKSDPGVMKSE